MSIDQFEYHLLTGSNLGDRAHQLSVARRLIEEKAGKVEVASRIYETQPWGYDDQPWFLNQALRVISEKSPFEMLMLLQQIEVSAGRKLREKWHARHLDIDILFCGSQVIDEPGLRIPHPELHKRNFVLAPLLEISPELLHPVLNKTIEELFMESRDTGEVFIFDPGEDDESL